MGSLVAPQSSEMGRLAFVRGRRRRTTRCICRPMMGKTVCLRRSFTMRRSNQPPSTRPAIARPPARPAARPSQAPQTWDDVRQWAAENGLDSAEAMRQWINETAPRGLYDGIDPRAAALLQTLHQFSMASSSGQPAHDIRELPPAYDALLGTLSGPRVGTWTAWNIGRYYPSGVDGPEWLRPLVDPLAEGGRLWPPSPVTVAVRMGEIIRKAYGYTPQDSGALIVDLADQSDPERMARSRAGVLRMLLYFGMHVQAALDHRPRIDPLVPKLASDADIAEAQTKWPNGFQPPYVFVVGQGRPSDPRGAWTPATGPIHVALLISNDLVVGRLVVSDTTGSVVDANGVFAEHWDPGTLPIVGDAIPEASGYNPRVVADLVAPFVSAVRAGRDDAVGMESMTGAVSTRVVPREDGVVEPFMARSFEPAEVLAALLTQRRAAAVDAINEATASAGGLARMAAQAYRGNIATANVPEEVRELIAAQAVARACSADATPQERARVDAAARVLGLPEEVRAQDLATICEASAEAVRRLYRPL
ncbi:hypothetical protein psal_cds_1187 [Pandoravirus salinus]|uniref:DUF5848 domain-containing protein n=1 Tax=Pandoravirus salinus TaxID=1349410 RepID=S4W122_9VIRU|nr:hypothetical protein psal_cds_1187 [Pandoravirus salinus]AGO85471.1 hypothetical protein psal_cds_1187 [Pandoravirus salinus]